MTPTVKFEKARKLRREIDELERIKNHLFLDNHIGIHKEPVRSNDYSLITYEINLYPEEHSSIITVAIKSMFEEVTLLLEKKEKEFNQLLQ